MMKTAFNWKLFLILLAGAIAGLVAIVPYSLALQGEANVSAAAAQTGLPLWQLIVIQLASQVILFGAAIWVGLSFANSIGLGLPLLEAALRRERISERLRRILPISILLGVVLALLLIALDVFAFQPALSAQGAGGNLGPTGIVKPEAWKGFLASFYGGINEELLLRLCVMSFLAWLGRFLFKRKDGKPTLGVLWAANVIAALLFGLGHLPVTSQLVALTPVVVLRAIVLNGLIGVGFGYLYFKHGLESAMISHFSADLVLHVLFAA